MKNILFALAAVALASVSAHSSGLFLQRRDGDVPTIPPPAISYHLHLVFNLSNPTSLQPAIALRDQARA